MKADHQHHSVLQTCPTQRALDAGDCRFAACGTNGKHLAKRGFKSFLLANFVHARARASNASR